MTTTDQPTWQFWIDVGGTFTDCVARSPDGQIERQKVLSSGATKGQVGPGSDFSGITDAARCVDPPDFWLGYQVRLLDRQGAVVAQSEVARFDPRNGRLDLTQPLPESPAPGQVYELHGGEEAPILAIRRVLGLPLSEPLPPVAVRLGTTRGTNALITRRGARAAFVTTAGFGDVLYIGYQNRPRLFDLAIRKPPPLFTAVGEIEERISVDGEVLLAPDEHQIRQTLERLRRDGVQSLAICLLNAYAHPQHEELVERIARDVGFEEISRSSRVAPLIKLVARGDTTVVDAYLNPILRRYVSDLRRSLDKGGRSDMRILTSAGALVSADRFVGKDSILSGPAGGVVGFSRVGKAAGFARTIGFDMGGTSTDVSRFDGRYELEYETEKAGVRVVAPMMSIETVAAGGGSICHFDGVKLAVGPDSAGADPGPACYGRGGPLAATDVNFFLGKILPAHFPFPLDRGAVESKLAELARDIKTATGKTLDPIELADGFLRVANANMAQAIRSVSIAKGYDPRDYVLVSFGGAAPQHACAVADELGIRRILNHPDGGVLSAVGLGMADVAAHRVQGVYRPYSEEAVSELDAAFRQLEQSARDEVVAEGMPSDRIDVHRLLDLRYQGLDAYLTVAQPNRGSGATWADVYAQEHRRLYGYEHRGRALEIVAARVEAIGRSSERPPAARQVDRRTPSPVGEQAVYFDARRHEAHVYDRRRLVPGDFVAGPAVIIEAVSTTIVDPGWTAELLSDGQLLLERSDESTVGRTKVADTPAGTAQLGNGSRTPCGQSNIQAATAVPADAPAARSGLQSAQHETADPILLEIFNNHFAGIAQQMGITLRNTASSVNVKERLDFSCAVFTADGDLVANAPHIPVHLGAMSQTVRRVLADNPDMAAGDVFVTNDPYRGGSHLPDVTVVTPIHDPHSGHLIFFTASRAHHAEIGGVTPGSMPPLSQNLAEEGVLIRNFKLVAGWHSRTDELRRLLLGAPYPTRNVEHNLADIAAQVAANHQGARDLAGLIERYSLPVVAAYMGHIQRAAEQKMRAALKQLPDGQHTFVDHLDDGSPIAVSVLIDGDSAVIDLTGTGPVLPGNLNANPAIVTAAVMYVLRCLIDEDIPLNQGVLKPVEIVLPECLLHPPQRESPAACAAVVGGNVETSQRVVDALLGALRLAAGSQGTMNNLLFGDDTFGYYETICGGSGATADCDGADAVHTHMTNTRLTDPEVIEQRFPVRVQEFAIRRGSGGAGRRRGGDGVVRRIEFLRDLEVSILSQRRGSYRPYGIDGGQPGASGRNELIRADGTREVLAGQVSFSVRAGDVLVVETPGGGGFGK